MKQKLNRTVQKIALILVCITTLNFIAPTQISNAGLGGVLFDPIKSVTLTLADVVMQVIQFGFTGTFRGTVRSEALDGNYSETNIWTGDDDKIDYPDIVISPEAIFSNQIEILNIDFINPITNKDYKVSSDKTTKALSSLRSVIASWYVAIRNLALVAMLSILVYVGIKIIISSTASDKAKYKQMLVDWLVGMCLLFMLHYIMAFTIFLTEKITDMISSSAEDVQLYYPTALDAWDDAEDEDMKSDREKEFTFNYNCNTYAKNYKKNDKLESLPNLTAYARFYAQMGGKHDKAVLTGATYLIIYIVLIVYTVKFAVVYMKRVVMIAFLTIIAPFVAMTYPLDKMNDGKAQAFNMWFKEYLFNALIQPFHLVLYTVLIGTSVELARTNLIYALVALLFISQAEKLLKKMFGFDKAVTPPGIGGAIAAGAGSQLTKNLLSRGKGGSNAKDGTGGNGSAEKGKISRKSPNYNLGSNVGAQSEVPSGLQEAADGSLALGADIMDDGMQQEEKNDKDKQKKQEPDNQDYRDNLTNNQNAELDAYNNSPAYGNGNNNENKEDKNSGENSGKNNQDNNKNEKPKGTARKMAALAKKKAFSAAGRTIKNPKTWKNLGKTAGRIAGAAGGAMVGLSAAAITGALTGDASKAMAAFGTATALGSKAGGTVGSLATKIPGGIKDFGNGFTDFKTEATEGWDKMQENKKIREQQQRTKEFMNNGDNQKYFEQRTGKYGAEREQIMAQASKYNQYEGFEDNDAKMQAIELENYYKEQGLNDKEAMQFVLASKSMTKEYSKKDLNQKSTYINELNAEGAQNDSNATKNWKADLLMDGVQHMKGNKEVVKNKRKAPSNAPEMNNTKAGER